MLISPKAILNDAQKRGYAVPAFNFYNLDGLIACLEAAEEEDAPVIVQTYSTHYEFLHHEVIGMAALEAAGRSKACAVLHMDHAVDYDLLMRAIKNGYPSVMADGSLLSLEENIKLTKSVVDVAKSMNVYTEAEIGHIYRVGVDDGEEHDETAAVEDCVRLVEETGVDSLAPAVGTAHGVYTRPPEINFKRIEEIRQAVKVPLVLHGGSGTPDEMIVRAIGCGISKINVGTELKHCWSRCMKEGLEMGEKEPCALSAKAREEVKKIAKQKLRLFGASGKSPEIIKELCREQIGG